MSKQELTDWYPPHIKPVRVGWYHTGNGEHDPCFDDSNESNYNWWWDGKNWVYDVDRECCYAQNRWWRGLKRPAK